MGSPHDHCIDKFLIERLLFAYTTESKKVKIKLPPLKPIERCVLMALNTRRNTVSFKCNPSLERLAEDLNVSKRHVSTALKGLKDKGIIRATPRYKEDSLEKLPSQYWIMIDIERVHSAFNDEEATDFIILNYEDVYECYLREFNRGQEL